ncbi:hypothetical protein [Mycolicibacterium sp.]|uniref:DUF7257 domain-containing protein n=1 Tax=Mycolicibacterium sp. TaxID=2320850 RepID=UPI0037C9613D
MTTPGGVPNLPAGGMTLETLQSMLQDMTPPAMRVRAAQRIPGTYDGSTGGNPLNDLTPFGILTTLFAGFNSHVANADPADIQGPEDLPGLLLDFIESLPVVGQLVGLLEAILGTYDGDDAILLEIQKFFGLFRDLFGLIDLDLDDLPTVEEVWQLVVTNFIQPLLDLIGAIGDGLNAILSPIFNGIDFTDPPTPAEVWQTIATVFLAPLNIFAIPSDVQASINGALGDLQDALDGSYTGSGPIFLAVQELAKAWLTATSPLNSGNLFGRIGLPQFGSGVPIMALTTAVPNELEPFSATSVPTADGWSFNAGQNAAQVVADGSTKTLYLQSGVIKVEAGQPLDTGVSVTYSGVTSGAGQAIRYVLETFTSDDGSGTATPVTVGSVSNPSGTITTPVLLGNSSWAIPAGVQSVRPVLVVDSLITAGTVFWKNTPTLKKKLAGQLAGGLPNALDNAGQAIRDAIANALGHSGTGHTSANILTYLQNIPQTVVSGLGDLNTLTNQIRDILAGLVVTPINSTVQAIKDWFTGLTGKTSGLNSSGQLNGTNIVGTIASGVVEGLDDIGDGLQNTWNNIWAGLRGAGSASGKNVADVATATSATADLITQVSSTAARLDAAVSQVIRGGGGGATDQFEREDTDLGDDWASTNVGAGAIVTDGSSATWSPSGGSAASQIALNINAETTSNYQDVSVVLTKPLNTTSGWLLLGRMNAARDTYVYMFFKKDYREIGCVISGTPTVLGTLTVPFDPPPGHKVQARFGHTGFTEDTFVLGSTGEGLIVSSAAPAKGDAYRHMGLGAKVAAVSGAQVSPGSLELWTGNDAQSPPTVGVYLEAQRRYTSGYVTLAAGPHLPANFMTIVRQSDWVTFDTSTNTVTVELPGAYHLWASVEINANITTNNTLSLYTFPVGGAPDDQLYAPRLVPGMGFMTQMSGVMYLDAGDSIELCCETTGTQTKNAIGSFRIAKLSPPYFA